MSQAFQKTQIYFLSLPHRLFSLHLRIVYQEFVAALAVFALLVRPVASHQRLLASPPHLQSPELVEWSEVS